MEMYHPLLENSLIEPPPVDEKLLADKRMINSKEIRDQAKSMMAKELSNKTLPTYKQK